MTAETILAIGIGVRAAPAPFVPGTGQSFTLRSQDPNSGLYLVDIGTNFSVVSDFRIHSPRMHDNVLGIHIHVPNTGYMATYGQFSKQSLVQQDNIQIIGGIGGGAATFDNVFMTVFYENLIGASGDLRHASDVLPNIKNLLTVNVAPVPSALGDWSAPVAINALDDLFKANTNYAILGPVGCDTNVMIGVQGPCTGNVIYGMPFIGDAYALSSSYNIRTSQALNLPLIPVFTSNDKGATFVYVADPAAAFTLGGLLLAELGS